MALSDRRGRTPRSDRPYRRLRRCRANAPRSNAEPSFPLSCRCLGSTSAGHRRAERSRVAQSRPRNSGRWSWHVAPSSQTELLGLVTLVVSTHLALLLFARRSARTSGVRVIPAGPLRFPFRHTLNVPAHRPVRAQSAGRDSNSSVKDQQTWLSRAAASSRRASRTPSEPLRCPARDTRSSLPVRCRFAPIAARSFVARQRPRGRGARVLVDVRARPLR